ncbi:MAG TPA: ABC transporter permease [Salinivirgaceae bacterium]|nr:ABC transporter permease [Salinivirgaceae bacterium]
MRIIQTDLENFAKIRKKLKFEYFIAKRLYKERHRAEEISKPMLKISIAGIALGIAVMLIAISISIGFKNEIQEKITGFSSHIKLINFEMGNPFDTKPIDLMAPNLDSLWKYPHIKHIQRYINKPAILRAGDNLQAIVFKGVSSDFDSMFIAKYRVAGKIPQYNDSVLSNEVLISEKLANKLNLNVGDRLPSFFMQKPIRYRNFVIAGIFKTHMEMYDENFMFCDIKQLQKLNGWNTNEVTGLELFIHDFSALDEVADDLRYVTATTYGSDEKMLRVMTIKDVSQNIFQWFELLNTNVYVIIILMVLVSATTMITGLLILILERIRFIGVLKTLGTSNGLIQKIFLIRSGQIIGYGLFIGNIIAAILIALQHYGKIIKLDPENYYLSVVPAEVSIFWWFFINLAIFAAMMLIMKIPLRLITKIEIAETIKKD